jgi:16S rRNA (cytosine1402-N4)-methyltransferase
MDSKAYHIPVLLPECIDGLKIKADGIYVDVTYGGGGHSKAIASLLTTGKVIAFDRDADALKNSITNNKNLIVIHSSFSNITTELNGIGITAVDGVLADLGVSSYQFDEPQRGFAFRFDSKLDMRMDVRQHVTAATVLNTYSAKELQQIFSLYGEVRNAATVAREIVAARQQATFVTTADLKKCVAHLVPKSDENGFYARLFQALRIEVNNELNELEMLLQQLPGLIKADGRLCVMSYHSLEDRLVKNFIASGNVQGVVKQDVFGNITSKTFSAINKKPIEADEIEKANNPRSRSARLRVAERIK